MDPLFRRPDNYVYLYPSSSRNERESERKTLEEDNWSVEISPEQDAKFQNIFKQERVSRKNKETVVEGPDQPFVVYTYHDLIGNIQKWLSCCNMTDGDPEAIGGVVSHILAGREFEDIDCEFHLNPRHILNVVCRHFPNRLLNTQIFNRLPYLEFKSVVDEILNHLAGVVGSCMEKTIDKNWSFEAQIKESLAYKYGLQNNRPNNYDVLANLIGCLQKRWVHRQAVLTNSQGEFVGLFLNLGRLDLKFIYDQAWHRHVGSDNSFRIRMGAKVRKLYSIEHRDRARFYKALEKMSLHTLEIEQPEKITRDLFWRLVLSIDRGSGIYQKDLKLALEQLYKTTNRLEAPLDANRFTKKLIAFQRSHCGARVTAIAINFFNSLMLLRYNGKEICNKYYKSIAEGCLKEKSDFTIIPACISAHPELTPSFLKLIKGIYLLSWMQRDSRIKGYALPPNDDVLMPQLALTYSTSINEVLSPSSEKPSLQEHCQYIFVTHSPLRTAIEFIEGWQEIAKAYSEEEIHKIVKGCPGVALAATSFVEIIEKLTQGFEQEHVQQALTKYRSHHIEFYEYVLKQLSEEVATKETIVKRWITAKLHKQTFQLEGLHQKSQAPLLHRLIKLLTSECYDSRLLKGLLKGLPNLLDSTEEMQPHVRASVSSAISIILRDEQQNLEATYGLIDKGAKNDFLNKTQRDLFAASWIKNYQTSSNMEAGLRINLCSMLLWSDFPAELGGNIKLIMQESPEISVRAAGHLASILKVPENEDIFYLLMSTLLQSPTINRELILIFNKWILHVCSNPSSYLQKVGELALDLLKGERMGALKIASLIDKLLATKKSSSHHLGEALLVEQANQSSNAELQHKVQVRLLENLATACARCAQRVFEESSKLFRSLESVQKEESLDALSRELMTLKLSKDKVQSISAFIKPIIAADPDIAHHLWSKLRQHVEDGHEEMTHALIDRFISIGKTEKALKLWTVEQSLHPMIYKNSQYTYRLYLTLRLHQAAPTDDMREQLKQQALKQFLDESGPLTAQPKYREATAIVISLVKEAIERKECYFALILLNGLLAQWNAEIIERYIDVLQKLNSSFRNGSFAKVEDPLRYFVNYILKGDINKISLSQREAILKGLFEIGCFKLFEMVWLKAKALPNGGETLVYTLCQTKNIQLFQLLINKYIKAKKPLEIQLFLEIIKGSTQLDIGEVNFFLDFKEYILHFQENLNASSQRQIIYHLLVYAEKLSKEGQGEKHCEIDIKFISEILKKTDFNLKDEINLEACNEKLIKILIESAKATGLKLSISAFAAGVSTGETSRYGLKPTTSGGSANLIMACDIFITGGVKLSLTCALEIFSAVLSPRVAVSGELFLKCRDLMVHLLSDEQYVFDKHHADIFLDKIEKFYLFLEELSKKENSELTEGYFTFVYTLLDLFLISESQKQERPIRKTFTISSSILRQLEKKVCSCLCTAGQSTLKRFMKFDAFVMVKKFEFFARIYLSGKYLDKFGDIIKLTMQEFCRLLKKDTDFKIAKDTVPFVMLGLGFIPFSAQYAQYDCHLALKILFDGMQSNKIPLNVDSLALLREADKYAIYPHAASKDSPVNKLDPAIIEAMRRDRIEMEIDIIVSLYSEQKKEIEERLKIFASLLQDGVKNGNNVIIHLDLFRGRCIDAIANLLSTGSFQEMKCLINIYKIMKKELNFRKNVPYFSGIFFKISMDILTTKLIVKCVENKTSKSKIVVFQEEFRKMSENVKALNPHQAFVISELYADSIGNTQSIGGTSLLIPLLNLNIEDFGVAKANLCLVPKALMSFLDLYSDDDFKMLSPDDFYFFGAFFDLMTHLAPQLLSPPEATLITEKIKNMKRRCIQLLSKV